MISAIAAFALAIAEQEHTPEHWNNPLALVYVHQAYAIKGAGGYANFDTEEHGMEAGIRDIRAKLNRGLTYEKILEIWPAAGYGNAYRDKIFKRLEAYGWNVKMRSGGLLSEGRPRMKSQISEESGNPKVPCSGYPAVVPKTNTVSR